MADNTITFGCNLSVDNFWDLPEFAKRAEDLGFDRVAIGEHVMDGNPPRPTAMGLPAMAAAAGATTRLRVLTGIVIAPLYHPVMLAKLVATVDQISGGRLDFGIGISGQRDTRAEFDALEIGRHGGNGMADNTITFGCNLSVDNFWDLPEFAKRAEDLGFDRVAIGEHVMDGNPPRPTAMGLPAMAAAAGATTRLRVLTGIVIAPLYHPVMLAKLVATVDQISGGRLDFGIGISGQRDTRAEFDALEIPVNTRGRRTDEILRAMKQLWQEDHVSHHGRFFNYDDVTLLPKPFQQPYPPIWVAGRSDAAVRRAAIAGDGWYPYLFTVNRLRRSNASVRDMAEQSGRDLSRFHWGLNQPTAINEDPDQALETAVAHVGQRYVTPERSAEDIARALCITGNAEDCIGAVQERIDAGVRDFVFGFLAGEADDYFRQMELFSSRVLTHFK